MIRNQIVIFEFLFYRASRLSCRHLMSVISILASPLRTLTRRSELFLCWINTHHYKRRQLSCCDSAGSNTRRFIFANGTANYFRMDTLRPNLSGQCTRLRSSASLLTGSRSIRSYHQILETGRAY